MTNASPEFEKHIRECYARIEPDRLFQLCKVAEDEKGIVVLIYSHTKQSLGKLHPTPYEILRFDSAEGSLTQLPREESEPFVIQNYK